MSCIKKYVSQCFVSEIITCSYESSLLKKNLSFNGILDQATVDDEQS